MMRKHQNNFYFYPLQIYKQSITAQMVSFYSYMNLGSGLIALAIALYIILKANNKAPRFLSWLFISAAWWSISLFFEGTSKTLNGHIFWTAFSYPGNMMAPVFLFLFFYHYTHFDRKVPDYAIGLTMVIPFISSLLVWFPGLRHLVWSDISLNSTPWGEILHLEHGWWYYIEVYYSYLLTIIGILYLIRGFTFYPKGYTKQIRLLLISSIIPLLLNVIYTLNSNRFYGMDLTSVAFTLSSSLFYITITRYRLLSLAPVTWNTVINNIEDGVIVIVNESIVGINPAAKKILKDFGSGCREGDSVSEGMKDFKSFIDFYFDASKEKEDFSDGEHYFIVTKNRVSEKSDIKTSLTVIFHDVTELKQKEIEIKRINQQLTESNFTKDTLFKVISHDLRGPVGTVTAYLRILVEGDGLIERKDLEILYQTISNASFLIDNMLFWAIGQSQGFIFHPEVQEISVPLIRAIEAYRFHADQKKITITNKAPQHIRAFFDPLSFEIVLRNLISNAIKFSYPGNEIEICSVIHEETVSIMVKDEGVGISEEAIHQILHDHTVKSERGTMQETGTGIGLNLCARLIRENQGELNIAGRKGEGTTVTITLPINKPD
jgi:signal transduction histidine kinase